VVVPVLGVVEPDVGDLVCQRLDRLGVVDVVSHLDAVLLVVGPAVGSSAIAPMELEAGIGHLLRQRFPQALGCLTDEVGARTSGNGSPSAWAMSNRWAIRKRRSTGTSPGFFAASWRPPAGPADAGSEDGAAGRLCE
jgi:hypothetical protein